MGFIRLFTRVGNRMRQALQQYPVGKCIIEELKIELKIIGNINDFNS
jgi:hypothetical protein|tara:strand:+ start:2807 stop:2947 length:141 start_codon:yes stop_codon:yes gene_type:complete